MKRISMFAACLGFLVGCSVRGPAGANGATGPAGPGGDAGVTAVDALELPGPAYYPESLSAAQDGTIYVGSLATGAVMMFKPGEEAAQTFLAPGTVKGIAGVLVDDSTRSLLVCAVDASFASVPSVQRYDLATGAMMATFAFPGPGTNPFVGFPNDMAFDGAHHLYITDSFGGKIYQVPDVTTSMVMTVWASDPLLAPVQANTFGADGISWDTAGAFYVNNNNTGDLIKIPINSNGTAGTAVRIVVTPALAHPDGQRQLSPQKLVIADNVGVLSTVLIEGDTGTRTVIDNRLEAPTSVVKVGNEYWVAEGQITSSLLTGTPPNLPFRLQEVVAY